MVAVSERRPQKVIAGFDFHAYSWLYSCYLRCDFFLSPGPLSLSFFLPSGFLRRGKPMEIKRRKVFLALFFSFVPWFFLSLLTTCFHLSSSFSLSSSPPFFSASFSHFLRCQLREEDRKRGEEEERVFPSPKCPAVSDLLRFHNFFVFFTLGESEEKFEDF